MENVIMSNKEKFISNAERLHTGKYDYSMVNYINSKTKVTIICKIHGDFESIPNWIISGRGCPKCGTLSRVDKSVNKNWILGFTKIHGDKYDYSKVIYVNNKKKVEVICKYHGSFFIKPNSHTTQKQGCRKCSIFKVNNTEEFILNSNIIHNGKYKYSNSIYKNSHIKVIITCPNHGIFTTRPNDHMNGQGCPMCNTSKGERKIISLLEESNHSFLFQHKFENCKSKNNICLKFDFYLPSLNICIEYDGEQHFKPVDFFGGLNEFYKIKERDKIKDDFCINNEIKLIRIPYNEFNNIKNILNFYI